MTPALAIVAIYALLLAWNEYLYQAVLLSVRNMTVSVTQGQLFEDVDAPYNAMMAAADHLCAAADSAVVCAAPLRRGEPHDGWRQGLTGASRR